MKRIAFALMASGMLFFAACHNQGSSTVATRDDDETTTTVNKDQEHEATEGERDHTEVKKQDSVSVNVDTTTAKQNNQ